MRKNYAMATFSKMLKKLSSALPHAYSKRFSTYEVTLHISKHSFTPLLKLNLCLCFISESRDYFSL